MVYNGIVPLSKYLWNIMEYLFLLVKIDYSHSAWCGWFLLSLVLEGIQYSLAGVFGGVWK